MKRAQAEIYCDIFAAELLLPFGLFKPLAEGGGDQPCLDRYAGEQIQCLFNSRRVQVAAVLKAPCAFVFSEKGKVRYGVRSTALRDAGAWIAPRIEMPQGSLSARLRGGTAPDGPAEIEADEWFQHWERGGTLVEEARHLDRFDQTLTLLWFEDEEVPPPKRGTGRDTEI